MIKVLVTGFDPFGGETINPALEAVKALEEEIAGAAIIKMELPTVFQKSAERLIEAVKQEKPQLVICVGQAGGRFGIGIERVAINIDDAPIPDNEGNQPVDRPIQQDGENAYFTNLPIKAMVEKLKSNGLPASTSNTAGTFVCNHIMYHLLYYINRNSLDMKGGFIHVPFIPKQVVAKNNVPSMALEDIVKGLTLAIQVAVEKRMRTE